MHDDVAISVQNVTMSFNLNKEKVDNLKEYVIKFLKGNIEYKKFSALKNINFEVKKGEHLAILGFNGAGKSTLLKTIVGVYKPSEGKVEKQGVIAPLLELGAGFDPNYSGKENIFLYGAILGYSREYIQSKYDEIVEFSELGHFIDVPLKNYSSGMKARLGFSIATAVEPDVLILDEVLSVGDAKFRTKSLKKVQSMFDKGVTVLFVSHSIEQVKAICDKAILLNHGEVIAQGNVDEVSDVYERMTKGEKEHKFDSYKELDKVSGLKVLGRGGAGERLKIGWNAHYGSESYNVYIKENSAWKYVGSTTETNYLFDNLVPGGEYFYRVAGVKHGNESSPSDELHTFAAYAPMPVRVSAVTEKCLKLDWDVTDCSGYVVEWSTDCDFKTDINIEEVNDSDIQELTVDLKESADHYYIRIRAKRNFNGSCIYGIWSDPIKAEK